MEMENVLKTVLEDREMLKSDKEDIQNFVQYMLATQKTAKRVVKYLYTLRSLSRRFGKPFREIAKKDVEKVMAEIEMIRMNSILVSSSLNRSQTCPYFYRVLAERLSLKANMHGFITMPDVSYILVSFFRVKKDNRLQVLKEMKNYGLVIRINTKSVWMK
ncbi:MAG: hypothetical protein HYW26_02930 [Candidatus Aenigmarchaeota archaeon]|nr:hypothetical protein [Candidatus Aenigmarchaeota archaeon]